MDLRTASGVSAMVVVGLVDWFPAIQNQRETAHIK
jgi:hypothetical protein